MEWINDFKTKGYVKFRAPELAELVTIAGLELIHTEEMFRDNFKEDLPTDINKQLSIISNILKSEYIDIAFPDNKFIKYILWEGVDADSATFHTDVFEGMNCFFILYFDDMKEETGGVVGFKYEGIVDKHYPKRGDLILFNQSPGFFHMAEKATIPRRQASFDFLVQGL